MSANRAVFVGAVALVFGLGSSGPASAQLGQTSAPSVAVPADPNNPGASSSGSLAAIGIADPSGLSFGVTPGGTMLANPSDAASAGTSTGFVDPGGLNLDGTTSSGLSTGQLIGGIGCAPPGSAAAFAGTSQPGLCPGSTTGGGGSPGAGFSGGSAASSADPLIDPLFGAGQR